MSKGIFGRQRGTGGHKGILCVYLLSLPVRGAWIEMELGSDVVESGTGRSL